MGIDKVSLDLLEHQKQDQEYQGLHRVFQEDQDHPGPAAHESPEDRHKRSNTDHHPHQQGVRDLQDQHRHHKQTSQDQRLHALPGQKSGKRPIGKGAHLQRRLRPASPDKGKKHRPHLPPQLFLLQKDIESKGKCDQEGRHLADDTPCCRDCDPPPIQL